MRVRHAHRAHPSPLPQVSGGLGTHSHGPLRDSDGDSVAGRPVRNSTGDPARPAADVADFINALWSRGGARGARHWSAEGATGGEHASAGGACSLADGGVAGVRAERATGAPKARRAERASAQAEHAGTRWSHRRSADNFTVQRSAPTGHLVLNKATTTYKNVYLRRYFRTFEGTF